MGKERRNKREERGVMCICVCESSNDVEIIERRHELEHGLMYEGEKMKKNVKVREGEQNKEESWTCMNEARRRGSGRERRT